MLRQGSVPEVVLLDTKIDRFWLFSADHGYSACWSNPMQSSVRTNASDWSGRMQTDSQMERNFAVKKAAFVRGFFTPMSRSYGVTVRSRSASRSSTFATSSITALLIAVR